MKVASFKRFTLSLLASFVVLGSLQTVHADAGIRLADQNLILNGQGLRKKGPFKVYQVSLYLSAPANSSASVISQDGPKRVALKMLRKVKKEKMLGAIIDGFKANTQDMSTIEADIDEFVTLLGDANKGQSIIFDYIPEIGTTISQGGIVKGTIEGEAFFTGLLKVWLGDNPVQARLKVALLKTP